MSKITNDYLALSGTECFTAEPIWQQCVSKGYKSIHFHALKLLICVHKQTAIRLLIPSLAGVVTGSKLLCQTVDHLWHFRNKKFFDIKYDQSEKRFALQKPHR